MQKVQNQQSVTAKEVYSKVDNSRELNMKKKTLDEGVSSKIESFIYYELTQEQLLLVDKLITDEELKERYKKYGLCKNCRQPNTGGKWCKSCNSRRFQQNFKNWTSGNQKMDEFIQEYQLKAINKYCLLEWIPYSKFTSIEYVDKGGFSKIYRSQWIDGRIDYWSDENNRWERNKYSKSVILKVLNNSQNMTTDFLREITNYKLFGSDQIIKCYGISQVPETGDYLMVMNYMKEGSLRKYLRDNCNKLSFRSKLYQLYSVVKGLNSIHQQGLIHGDFHSGNVLNQIVGNKVLCYIADLGLCRPVDEKDKSKIYGVLPYVAPEVLRGESYTQKSDIYSFGMVAYEILSGHPPYYKSDYDVFMALKICNGLRPDLKIKIPPLLEGLIKRCWDAEPLLRPSTGELEKIISSWLSEIDNFCKGNVSENSEFFCQYKELNKFHGMQTSACSCESYSQEKFTSRLLDFANLLQPQNSQEINDQFYKTKQLSLELEFNKLSISESMTEQLENRVEIPTNLLTTEKIGINK